MSNMSFQLVFYRTPLNIVPSMNSSDCPFDSFVAAFLFFVLLFHRMCNFIVSHSMKKKHYLSICNCVKTSAIYIKLLSLPEH